MVLLDKCAEVFAATIGVVSKAKIKKTFSSLSKDSDYGKALLEEKDGKNNVDLFLTSQFSRDDIKRIGGTIEKPGKDGKLESVVVPKPDLSPLGDHPPGWAISHEQVLHDDVDWHSAGGDVDILVGLVFICPWLGYAGIEAGGVVLRLIPQILAKEMTAIALYRGATTACEVVVALQVFLLWVTFCFKFGAKKPHKAPVRQFFENIFTRTENAGTDQEKKVDRIQEMWGLTVLGQSGLPIGGFAPRLAALSMGFLLFAGGTLVAPTAVKGKDGLAKMKGFDGCRANGAEFTTDVWLKRLQRKPADGCVGGKNVLPFMAYFQSPDTFVVDDENGIVGGLTAGAIWSLSSTGQEYCRSNNKGIDLPSCWAYDNATGWAAKVNATLYKAPPSGEINPLHMEKTGKADDKGVPLFSPKNLNQPLKPCDNKGTGNCSSLGFFDETVPDFACQYQCVKWKQLSVSSVIKVSGAVFTGAFFLTKIIEGWTSVMGYDLITPSTKVEDLVRLLAIVRQYRTKNKCFGRIAIRIRAHMRRTVCALQLAVFWLLSYFSAPSLNIDGFFTADYYTTLIFIFAGLVSLTQRYWNPYQAAPLLYTKDLWMKGVDSFTSPGEDGGEAKQKKISLYEWIHLTPDERAEYLFKYARRVSEDEVKKLPADDLDDPGRAVISVSYCVDSQSITDYALAKTVPRKLGVPHGVHGQIQKIKDGKYEIQWKRVIGCGSAKDLELEHVRYLVDVEKVPKYDKTKTLHHNIDVMRAALCGGEEMVHVLSEDGKAFIVGCALKWHVLENGKLTGKTETVQNLDVKTSDMHNWPKIYMKHMKKWQKLMPHCHKDEQGHVHGNGSHPKYGEWSEFSHTPEDLLKELELDLFWAGGKECRPDASEEDHHSEALCTIKNCRWEGCVESYMVLESNQEWTAARTLLGLKSLKESMKEEQQKAEEALAKKLKESA